MVRRSRRGAVAWKTETPAAAVVEEAEEDPEAWVGITVVGVNGGQPYRALQKLELIEELKRKKKE